MVDFKYFADYERLAGLDAVQKECSICREQKNCFCGALYGTERTDRVCVDCLTGDRLAGRDIMTNCGNRVELVEQLSLLNPSASEDERTRLADLRSNELEKRTPHLITWQDMDWPCLDGDYAQFIGYGSKPMFASLDSGGDGRAALQRHIHPELYHTVDDGFWIEMVPDKIIKDYSDTEQYSALIYVFRSVVNRSNYLILWDCN